jgi:hypothetical protein
MMGLIRYATLLFFVYVAGKLVGLWLTEHNMYPGWIAQ